VRKPRKTVIPAGDRWHGAVKRRIYMAHLVRVTGRRSGWILVSPGPARDGYTSRYCDDGWNGFDRQPLPAFLRRFPVSTRPE
jgi:hypothetical protein